MAKTDFDPFFLLDTFGLEILRLGRRDVRGKNSNI